MNWVPGNLHLIGKDNQNNPPLLPKKVKTSSCPPPSLSLQACRNNGGGGGWQMLYSPRDSDFTESQSLQNKTVFVLLHRASYLSHNLKWKDSMVRWHLFQLSPLVSPQRPRAWRSPDCSWRGGHSLPNTDICPSCTLSSHQTVHILNRGVMVESESGREHPEP